MKAADARVVITGGASGLGNAVARHFVALGARVTMLDVQDGPGPEGRGGVRGGRASSAGDVTLESEVEAAMQAAAAWMGGIDPLVNCAGVIGAGRVFAKNGPMAGDFFAKVVHINLIGTFLVRWPPRRSCRRTCRTRTGSAA
ncbi:MAG: SDR family NAD(P)-dependent oxidoreductase [Steroidobacteraceae bacterium]